MKSTKVMVVVALVVLANCAFALTETVDGITWYYYVNKDNEVVLEYPNIRTSDDIQLPAHAGECSRVLRIPHSLGGRAVSEIGVFAIQTARFSTPPEVIVIPASVKSITACSFVGSLGNSQSSGTTITVITYYWGFPSSSLLFEGDAPTVKTNVTSWDYVLTFYDGTRHKYRVCHYYSQQHSWEVISKCVVEGTSGWNLREAGYSVDFGESVGFIKYGAAKIDIMPADGILADSNMINLICPNASAKIYYTLNGSEPTTS